MKGKPRGRLGVLRGEGPAGAKVLRWEPPSVLEKQQGPVVGAVCTRNGGWEVTSE